MTKLIALYKQPDDVETFDKHYFEVHIPLVKKIPGLLKCEVTRITGAPFGDVNYYLMAELYFDSFDAMNEGNATPEGKTTAHDLMSFASPYVTLFFGEVHE
ncbi:MAG: EthD family reductase [Ignavibacteriae bacterium]|nr:EthD family reductase [Ignavibacteriota bacterium]